jgi:hypothetical protein
MLHNTDLTSTTTKGPLTNQMHLNYPTNQSDALKYPTNQSNSY